MALAQQPEFQRAMLKRHAKSSMRGNQANTRGLQSQLASRDIQRKQAFKGISQQRQRSDLAHAGRTAQYKMDRKALKDRAKQLPWQTGIGAGTALVSGLEGRRRANILREAEANRQKRFDESIAYAKERDDFYRTESY